jgi:hypothetical protein
VPEDPEWKREKDRTFRAEALALAYWKEFGQLIAGTDPGREGVAAARDRFDDP